MDAEQSSSKAALVLVCRTAKDDFPCDRAGSYIISIVQTFASTKG